MTSIDATERMPIVVRWLWDDCHLIDGGRAYIVEIPAERAVRLEGGRSTHEVDAYLKAVATQVAMWPGTVTEGHVSCLFTADGRVVKHYHDPWFPYSNLWNAYCPLRRLGIRVAGLDDLVHIPDEVITRAIDDDIPSTWCLGPESWAGTELEVSQKRSLTGR